VCDVILTGGEAGAKDRTTFHSIDAAEELIQAAGDLFAPADVSTEPAAVRSFTRLNAGFRMTSLRNHAGKRGIRSAAVPAGGRASSPALQHSAK